MLSGNLNLLEPSGPVQACNGTALPYIKVYGELYEWVTRCFCVTMLTITDLCELTQLQCKMTQFIAHAAHQLLSALRQVLSLFQSGDFPG